MNRLLLFSILLLNLLYIGAEDIYDGLFDDIEIEDRESTIDSLTISGDFNVESSIPFNSLDNLKPVTVSNLIKFEYESENIDLLSSFKIEIDQNTKNLDTILKAKDNYLGIKMGSTTVKAGYFTSSWGHADKLNPTNKLDSVDYSDPYETESLESVKISLEKYIDIFSIEAVYIPNKSDPIFSKELLLPKSTTVVATKTKNNYVYGGRINLYSKVDLSLSYINDIDDLYTIKSIDQEFGTKLEKLRIHRFGISGKTTIESYGVWLESNYSLLDNGNNYLEGVIGFDRNIGPQSQGLINIQGFGRWNQNFDKVDPDNVFQNRDARFNIGLLSKISYSMLNSELKPELIFILLQPYYKETSVLLKPKISYTPLDSLQISFGIRLINKIDNRDNLFDIEINYSW